MKLDVPDDPAVARVVISDAGEKLIRRSDVGIAGAGGCDPVDECQLSERCNRFGTQPRYNFKRCAHRHEQALPYCDVVGRVEFRDGR